MNLFNFYTIINKYIKYNKLSFNEIKIWFLSDTCGLLSIKKVQFSKIWIPVSKKNTKIGNKLNPRLTTIPQ